MTQNEKTSAFVDLRELSTENIDAVSGNGVLKLMTARSIPDAANVCQEWMSKSMNLWAQDSRWLMDDGQKFVQAGTKLWLNGFSGGIGAGT